MKAIQFKKWAKHQNKNLTEEDIQVTNKHEKMLVNRELQIKSIEILLCTFRMARMRKADKTKDAEQQELSLIAGVEAKRSSHFERWFGSFLQRHVPCHSI